MKRSLQIRIFVIFLVVGIQLGFKLGQTLLPTWQKVGPFIFAICCIFSLSVFLVLRGLEIRRMRTAVWLCPFLLIGFSYGCLRGLDNSTNLTQVYGIPIVGHGVITSVIKSRGRDVQCITITQVSDGSATYTCDIPCFWRSASNDSHVSWTAGSDCDLRGVLYPSQSKSNSHETRTALNLSGSVRLSKTTASLLDRVQSGISAALNVQGRLDATTVNLVESLLYGGGSVNQAEKTWFLEAGVLHVFAASGANVVLVDSSVQLLFNPLLRILRSPAVLRQSLRICMLWLFTALCNFSPSIVRACIMATYRHVGEYVGRTPSLLNSCLISLAVMSLLNPMDLTKPGTLLSFGATLAVYISTLLPLKLGPGWRKGRTKVFAAHVAQFLFRAVLTNIVVEFALLPISMAVFQQLTPYSILSNLVVEPILVVLLPILLVYIAACSTLHLFFETLSVPRFLSWIPTECLKPLLAWVHFIASQSGALLVTPAISTWWTVLYYVLLIGGLFVLKNWDWVSVRLCEKMNKVDSPVI